MIPRIICLLGVGFYYLIKICILMINFKIIHHLFVTVYSVYLLMSSAGVLVFSALPDDSVLSTKLFSN